MFASTLGLSEDTKSILQNDLSLENFIEKTVALCKLKS